MRVALLTDGIWPYVLGGMQKHSYYLCKYLAQNNVHVELFHFNQSNYDIQKLEYFSKEEKAFIASHVLDFPKSFPFPGHYLYNSYRYSKVIFNELKERLHEFDFIYTKGFSGWHLINMKCRRGFKCPPVGIKFHGYEMFQRAPDIKIKLQHIFLLRPVVKRLSLKADVVFSYGGKITDIIKGLGVKKSRIVELPSGVEQNSLAKEVLPVNTPLRFLFLGRYERRKGIEELNQTLKLLLADYSLPSFEMHFVGPIPLDKQVVANEIIYHGEVRDRGLLQTKIRHCDVLLCPSWSEGFPNVILEAMANGLTVIATDVGAINVLVNTDNGFLIPTAEVEFIFKAVKETLMMAPLALQIKKQNALSAISNKFTWEILIDKLIQEIKKLNKHDGKLLT